MHFICTGLRPPEERKYLNAHLVHLPAFGRGSPDIWWSGFLSAEGLLAVVATSSHLLGCAIAECEHEAQGVVAGYFPEDAGEGGKGQFGVCVDRYISQVEMKDCCFSSTSSSSNWSIQSSCSFPYVLFCQVSFYRVHKWSHWPSLQLWMKRCYTSSMSFLMSGYSATSF